MTKLLRGGEQAILWELSSATPGCAATKLAAVMFRESVDVNGATVRIPGGETRTGRHNDDVLWGAESITSSFSPTVMQTVLPFCWSPMERLGPVPGRVAHGARTGATTAPASGAPPTVARMAAAATRLPHRTARTYEVLMFAT